MDSRDNYPDRDRPQPPDYRRLPEDAPTEQFGYQPQYQQTPRRSSTGVWISVILLLAALIALLFFVLWLNNREDDDSSGSTVTHTVEETTTAPETTPAPAPEPDEGDDTGSDDSGIQLPSELPSQEDLEDWGNQLGDDVDNFLNDLNDRLNN
ncbi:MAG: hypothetical protein ACTJGE_09805 [Corynebacterium variabile]|uniref:hypothetical protein n=1 Tax=Corynebacterium variabile TaxID=1727 RepID=UPI003F921766